MHARAPIGIFDSGYGGLTVFRKILDCLPQYDYLYLGDNARAPYGNRSAEVVHQYTWSCVQWLLQQNCPLVILACNTASAKSLARIQQQELPRNHSDRRVLGVIRPTAEIIGHYTKKREIGILGTKGTIESGVYMEEIKRFFPQIQVHQQACPMWVHMIENNDHHSAEAQGLIRKYLSALKEKAPHIDLVLLACTHYPLIIDKIRAYMPASIRILSQGEIVAASLKDYLNRNRSIAERISTQGQRQFFTTDDPQDFNEHASQFFGEPIDSEHLDLSELPTDLSDRGHGPVHEN